MDVEHQSLVLDDQAGQAVGELFGATGGLLDGGHVRLGRRRALRLAARLGGLEAVHAHVGGAGHADHRRGPVPARGR